MQNEKDLKVVVTRVPPSLAIQLEKVAQQEMLPVSAFVRRLILKAMQSESRVAA